MMPYCIPGVLHAVEETKHEYDPLPVVELPAGFLFVESVTNRNNCKKAG